MVFLFTLPHIFFKSLLCRPENNLINFAKNTSQPFAEPKEPFFSYAQMSISVRLKVSLPTRKLIVNQQTNTRIMSIKKSELYSLLWASCDELRGRMDAGQYKDYVLVLFFLKYVSDKKDTLVEFPPDSTFSDMLKFWGKPEIGDKINTITGEFAKANGLSGIITEADFEDNAKLGSGKVKIDLMINLLNIFNKPELDFSKKKRKNKNLQSRTGKNRNCKIPQTKYC